MIATLLVVRIYNLIGDAIKKRTTGIINKVSSWYDG